MNDIAVLITCHNRKEKTLSCLDALFHNLLPDEISLEVYLVDDASTDGTEHAVQESYPQVHVVKGNGYLYWNRGMHMAFATAIKRGFDYYLWLNDDTLLYPETLLSLLNVSHHMRDRFSRSSIVVGSTHDVDDGRHTYGGVTRLNKWKATTFTLIEPRDVPVECETMNGNCVLIPCEIVQAIGNLEERFSHAMGDLDYGLRARNAGYSVWIMPGFAGTCSNNAATGTFSDDSLPLTLRLRKMLHPKGLPLNSWRVFTQRHAGVLWPVFWLWPYAKVMFKGMVGK